MDLHLQTLVNLETISDMFDVGFKGLEAATSISNCTTHLKTFTDLITNGPCQLQLQLTGNIRNNE